VTRTSRVAATRVTSSEAETAEEGRRLGARLRPGDVVVIQGPLGAGKTAFVRGLAEGLGLDPRAVHSPSFAILTEYGPSAAGVRLVHVDLYRIDDPAEIDDLGLTDHLAGGRVMAVEWGERLPRRLRDGAVGVVLEDLGGDRRRITIEGSLRP
jgi:tRNA threonylcarbamoyladenosine biosynthesis protein TsaE